VRNWPNDDANSLKILKKEIFCFNSDNLQRNEKVEKLLAFI